MIKSINTLCDRVLRITKSDLEELINNISTHYKAFNIIKQDKNGNPKLYPDGTPKIRCINPPSDYLKDIQRKIKNHIENSIEIPFYEYGGIKGKDNILNANVHKGKKYVFQTDITAFFPSISSKRIYELFIDLNYSPTVASILTKLTTYTGHLPQGAPTSSIIANLVFKSTGDKIMLLSEAHKLTLTTFVDDVTISSPKDFKALIPQIIAIIKDDGFRISDQKTTYKSGIKEITGVKVLNNTLSTTDKFNKKFDSKKDIYLSKVGMINYKERIKKIANNKKGVTFWVTPYL